MILYHQWIQLPLPVRIKLATHFGVSKTGSTHVQDNRVVSDGYDIAAIERALNMDAVQQFTESDSNDWQILWTLMIDKITGNPIVRVAEIEVKPADVAAASGGNAVIIPPANPPAITVKQSTPPAAKKVAPTKRGRPAKK